MDGEDGQSLVVKNFAAMTVRFQPYEATAFPFCNSTTAPTFEILGQTECEAYDPVHSRIWLLPHKLAPFHAKPDPIIPFGRKTRTSPSPRQKSPHQQTMEPSRRRRVCGQWGFDKIWSGRGSARGLPYLPTFRFLSTR
eukprot:scaffold6781_cov204-Amphora_coffeaeformis.AAC.18